MSHVKSSELISLRCPVCNKNIGVVREVYDNSNNNKKIKCNCCHNVSAKEYYSVVNNTENTTSESITIEEETSIAYLLNIIDNKRYDLKMGRNLIGRRSNRDFANIVIDTGGDKTMSREHVVIDIAKNKDNIYNFIIANYKNKNSTYINEKLLQKDNAIELFNNDMIKMAKIELKIIICV